MNKILPAMVAFGILALVAACGSTDGDGGAATPTPDAPPELAPTVADGGAPQGNVFPVTLQDTEVSGAYGFSPAELTFNVGDEITFVLTSEATLHTFTVDDLGINEDIFSMQTHTFTHVFDRPGVFKLICIPHEALGMVGTITVG